MSEAKLNDFMFAVEILIFSMSCDNLFSQTRWKWQVKLPFLLLMSSTKDFDNCSTTGMNLISI